MSGYSPIVRIENATLIKVDSLDNYFANTAPHAITVRATVTNLSTVIRKVKSARLLTLRKTAATTVGRARTLLTLNGITILQSSIVTNGVGDKSEVFVNLNQIFKTETLNNTVRIETEDVSVGGTVDYEWAVVYENHNP